MMVVIAQQMIAHAIVCDAGNAFVKNKILFFLLYFFLSFFVLCEKMGVVIFIYNNQIYFSRFGYGRT